MDQLIEVVRRLAPAEREELKLALERLDGGVEPAPATELSQSGDPALAELWDNEDDAACDAL